MNKFKYQFRFLSELTREIGEKEREREGDLSSWHKSIFIKQFACLFMELATNEACDISYHIISHWGRNIFPLNSYRCYANVTIHTPLRGGTFSSPAAFMSLLSCLFFSYDDNKKELWKGDGKTPQMNEWMQCCKLRIDNGDTTIPRRKLGTATVSYLSVIPISDFTMSFICLSCVKLLESQLHMSYIFICHTYVCFIFKCNSNDKQILFIHFANLSIYRSAGGGSCAKFALIIMIFMKLFSNCANYFI